MSLDALVRAGATPLHDMIAGPRPNLRATADAPASPSNRQKTWRLIWLNALACVVPSEVGCALNLASTERVERTVLRGDIRALASARAGARRRSTPPQTIQTVNDRFGLTQAGNGIIEAVRRATQRSTVVVLGAE